MFRSLVRRGGFPQGFKPGELGTLYGVSRETIYQWMKGNGPRQGGRRPGDHTETIAANITLKLREALDRGVHTMLGHTKEERARRIAKMAADLQRTLKT